MEAELLSSYSDTVKYNASALNSGSENDFLWIPLCRLQ